MVFLLWSCEAGSDLPFGVFSGALLSFTWPAGGPSGEIAGYHCHHETGADAFDAAQYRLGRSSDGFRPTERLLDLLAALLRQCVAVMAGGWAVKGGIPSDATVAHVLVSKCANHLPLYRQAQIYCRQGIDLDRSTLAAWVGKAAYELKPVFNALIADLKRSTKLFMPSRQIALQSPAG